MSRAHRPPSKPPVRTTAQARFNEGEAFFKQKRWDEALAAFRAAVEKDPEMSEAWYEIGMAEIMKNGKQPCVAAYGPLMRCLELNPNHAGAHCGLGNYLHRVCKDDARAEEHLQTAIRLDPNIAPAHFGLAGVLEKRGDLDGAMHEMREYIRKGDPDRDGEAHLAELRAKKAA